jgi:hypothetical protein
VHRSVVLRRRWGEPRHGGDIGLVEHGGIGRRVGRRRADCTLGWPWTEELADARLSHGHGDQPRLLVRRRRPLRRELLPLRPQSAGAPYPPPTPRLSCPTASLWGPAASSPSARHRRRSSSAVWWWKRRGGAATVRDFGGKMGICSAFWRETKLMVGNYPSVTDTMGRLDISRVFVSSGVPERASKSRGCPGLAGWMKAQIQAKTRNRRHDWTEYRRPDEKIACRGPTRGHSWRCSNTSPAREPF